MQATRKRTGRFRLLRKAVGRYTEALDAHTAISMLLVALELRCRPLRDRVSGYILARFDDLSDTEAWVRYTLPFKSAQTLVWASGKQKAIPNGRQS